MKQRETACKQACKMQDNLEAAYLDSVYYEDEMQAQNDQLTDHIKSAGLAISDCGSDTMFCFETLDGGNIYTTAVRELYYKLLVDQLPPAKISSTIRSILKSFLPSLDVDKLKLPGESCASYMRREELTTVNLAHNAANLLQSDSRFNKLVKVRREEEKERFGPAGECPDITELVENFCCMHLGVNLRKAFFDTAESGVVDNASSDVLVHEQKWWQTWYT